MNKSNTTYGFTTSSIHCGEEPDYGTCGNVVAPIHLSTTFARKDVMKPTNGFDYSRTINPTRQALESKLAAVEGSKYAFAFSSGFGACSMVLFSTLHAGDNMIALDDVYTGTKRVINGVLRDRFGVDVTYVSHTDFDAVEKAIRPNTRICWCEGLSNPSLNMVDISALSELLHRHGVLLVVDNTFMSPYFMRPLALGADIVVHSSTKYMCGHSDVISGVVMCNNDQVAKDLFFSQNAIGSVLSPIDSYMLMRGMKTMSVRMERHQQNAMQIARYLEQHPMVDHVLYPGLESHPQHELVKRQCTGFSGMITFELKDNGNPMVAKEFVENLNMIALAESLGGVESLIEIPSMMTNVSNSTPEERAALGINDLMVRLSVGIEETEDLIADIDQAFAAVSK